jgi:hypothetical protein
MKKANLEILNKQVEFQIYKQYIIESLKEFDFYAYSDYLEKQIDTDIEVFGNNIEVNATLSGIDIERTFVLIFTNILEMAENKMSDTKKNNNGLD